MEGRKLSDKPSSSLFPYARRAGCLSSGDPFHSPDSAIQTISGFNTALVAKQNDPLKRNCSRKLRLVQICYCQFFARSHGGNWVPAPHPCYLPGDSRHVDNIAYIVTIRIVLTCIPANRNISPIPRTLYESGPHQRSSRAEYNTSQRKDLRCDVHSLPQGKIDGSSKTAAGTITPQSSCLPTNRVSSRRVDDV